jgi:hypothetical protein
MGRMGIHDWFIVNRDFYHNYRRLGIQMNQR